MIEEEKNIITQDIKVAQQLIKQVLGNNSEGVSLNVINVGSISITGSSKSEEHCSKLDEEALMLQLISLISEPKLQNLEKLAIRTAINLSINQEKAGELLGISSRVMCYKIKTLGIISKYGKRLLSKSVQEGQ